MPNDLEAGDSAVTTADHAPETEETEAVEQSTAEEVPEAGEQPEVEEGDEGADAPEADVFEGLVQAIPTAEDIDKRFARAPKDIRGEFKRVSEIAKTSSDKLDGFGGDFAIDTLKPLASIVSKAEATDDELLEAVTSIVKANQVVGTQLLDGIGQAMLAHPRTADPLLQLTFGENASFDKIKRLLYLDESGLVDPSAETDEIYQRQSAENLELKRQLAEAQSQLRNPEKRPDNTKAVTEFDNGLAADVSAAIKPAFDRVQWSPESGLAKLVLNGLLAEIKADPKYRTSVTFLQQSGNSPLVDANKHFLKNQALSRSMQLIREVQSDLRAMSERSRNAQLVKKKEVEAEKEPAIQLPKGKELTPQQAQAELDRQYKEFLAGKRTVQQVASKV